MLNLSARMEMNAFRYNIQNIIQILITRVSYCVVAVYSTRIHKRRPERGKSARNNGKNAGKRRSDCQNAGISVISRPGQNQFPNIGI